MRVLIAIPHVFAPQAGSLYSSQKEEKRETKTRALYQATHGNLIKHGERHFIHASAGKGKEVFTRELKTHYGVDMTIQIYTPESASLAYQLKPSPRIQIIDPKINDFTKIPIFSSRALLEQADKYDLVGYMEDDLLIEDHEFFSKLLYLDNLTNSNYAFTPHRCEYIPDRGDVILSGDPDGGRPDLFWDTKEEITVNWSLGIVKFYRATNPHSGCYFLTRRQALKVSKYWEERDWIADFELSGPLEQAGSGILLPILKIMKPIPEHYRFLMVKHQDELWKRHWFEARS